MNKSAQALMAGAFLLMAGASAHAQTPPVEGETPPSPAEQRRTELELERDIAKLEQEIRTLRTPTLPESGVEGEMNVGDGAGEAEAMVLAARHLGDVGTRIISDLAPGMHGPVFVAGGDVFPDQTPLRVYEVRHAALTAQLGRARLIADQITAPGLGIAESGGRKGVGALSAAIPLINSLLSYFRSDYAAAGLDVPALDDAALVAAVLAAEPPGQARRLQPMTGPVSREVAVALSSELLALDEARSGLEPGRRRCVQMRALAEEEEAAAGRLASRLDLCAQLDLALSAYQTFGEELAADDGAQLGALLRLRQVARNLDQAGASVLLVRLHASTGGSFKQTNVFSALGAMPFHVTTSTIASWRQLDGQGQLVAAGWRPAYSGYRRLQEVDELINGPRRE